MSTIETKLAQIGNRSETTTGTVNPPVYFSTAYRHEGMVNLLALTIHELAIQLEVF